MAKAARRWEAVKVQGLEEQVDVEMQSGIAEMPVHY